MAQSIRRPTERSRSGVVRLREGRDAAAVYHTYGLLGPPRPAGACRHLLAAHTASPLSRLQSYALARSAGIAPGRHAHRSLTHAAVVLPRIDRPDAARARRCRSALAPPRERPAVDRHPR